jgi:hypothetical protein
MGASPAWWTTCAETGEILDRLAADPVVARVTELRVEVPYEFGKHEYEQILHDVRYTLAPQLGWTPGAAQRASAQGG